MYKNLISVSHNDLDGFACQYLIKKCAKFNKFLFANSNYQSIIKSLRSQIGKISEAEITQTLLILSDLSISKSVAHKIDNLLSRYNFLPEQVLVIDHHESTTQISSRYNGLYLDTSCCATKLVYNYLSNIPVDSDKLAQLESFTNRVNAYDLFNKEDKDFNQGLYMSDQLIEISRFVPEPLMNLRRNWIFRLLDSINSAFDKGSSIYDLDKLGVTRMLSIISPHLDEETLNNKNQSLLQKIYSAIANDVVKLELFERVELDNIRFAVMQNFGSFYYAVTDPIMDAFNDIDACIHINPKRNVSLRSQQPINILSIAQNYFGGGGHPCAAGGRLPENFNLNKNIVKQLKAYQQ